MLFGVPTGIRTQVTAVKGRCPRPLDDGDVFGGAKRDRTADPLHAMQVLSQLSYSPWKTMPLFKEVANSIGINGVSQIF